MTDLTEQSIKDIVIEARFNIRPGDSVNGVLLVERPDVAYEIGKYLKTEEAKRQIQLITRYGLEQRLDEVDHIPNPAYIGMDGKRKEPLFDYRIKRRKEVNEELQALTNQEGE